HRSEEGESVLEQPLLERISFIRGFLQKHCKHKSAAENLVSVQKLLEGEELALAKVAVLLLYHTSMSCRSPGDWNEFDYETQVELASILKFVLDNEESLYENLEKFLQQKAPPSSSGSSSEEPSPLLPVPQKCKVRFLELQKIASSSSSSSRANNMPPASPMGDVMQTPQFQLRRLKKQLAGERENRDELEVELAENRKLIAEKEAQITMMQQRIERLTLLNEKQAADQLEPKEMEELREKNESLMLRLHEALRQCQDLKTEKGQMDRKINQLSEENGDLSFKLREIASHLVQLQEALNELSEEHNAALAQAQEKQGQLESELQTALHEKKCSEEMVEILQGKISLLDDQLAKLGDCSTQEKGEVMGDVLKLEELKQEVSGLTAKGAELQATVLQLEEEKQQREAALQSERGRLEEEKQQLGNLVANLQSSLSESQRAQEKLEQDLRAREAEAAARQEAEAERLAALDTRHEKTLRERDSALQQLQQLGEANAALSSQLQAVAQARDAGQAAWAEEKAELSRRVSELEGRILELGAQQQQQGAAEELRARLRELEGRLRDSQQRLAEREKLVRENSRLQERLLFLEESLRNTEGILEDEKRRAAESLESSLARIAELEAERQQLVRERDEEPAERRALGESGEKATEASTAARGEDGERGRLEEEMRALSREHGRVCQQLRAEQEKAATLEMRAERLAAEHREKLATLQADLSSARARVKEKEGEEQKLRAEVSSLREKVAITEQAAAQRAAGLEADARRAAEALEGLSQQLSQEKLKSKELEAAAERLRNAEAELSRAAATGRQRELEVEVEMKKLSGEVTLLGARLEETLREHQQDLARWEEEAERLRQEVERAKADCAAERTRKAELEVKLQNSLNEQRVERSAHQEELERSRELLEEKDGEMEELRRKNISQGEELRDLQKTVSKLKGELAAAKVDNEPREGDSVQATCTKGTSMKSLEKKTHPREQEPSSNQDLPQEKLKEMQVLRLRVEGLEQKCREQQEAMAARERAAAEAALVERAELEASRRDMAQQKEKVSELQKLLEASRSTQALHDATVDALRKELQEKGRELSQSKAAAAAAEKELVSLRSAAQEKGRSEENWKEQVSQCVQELERKNSLISSLEHEVSILHRQVTEKEGESKELKRLILAESEKSKKLEERLRVLQTEMATAASRAAERCSLMKVEVQRCQEEMEKQRLAIEALKRDRHCQSQREDELRQEAKICQDKCLQKEQLLAALQQELGAAQALAAELPALKLLCQQLQAERASLESQHRQDLEQRGKTLAALQAELARAKLEAAELPSLRERSAEQDQAVQRLQAEAAEQAARLAGLQQANARLAEENRGLGESRSRGQQRLEAELGQARERHVREMERLRVASEELVASSRQEAEEAARKLEAMRSEHESSKAAALEERKKLLEEQQRLTAQVEQLEVFRKEQTKQVEELNKKLTQHEKATRTQQQRVKELQAEATRQQDKVTELQAQLAQKEQAAEHYKGQMEKAKTHYDAKKQQNQDLAEKLKAMEQLQKENTELRRESERLAKELEQSVLQAKESELSCRNLSSQVRSLEAQVEFANRQLQDLGKFQVTTDMPKGQEAFGQNPADLSADSLDLSLDDAQPLNSTRYRPRVARQSPPRCQRRRNPGVSAALAPRLCRKAGRSRLETSAVSQQLPHKVESLESLYFTPIPSRTRSRMESSTGSLGDVSLDSGCKTRSARRRTTINITMTKKEAKTEEPSSADISFRSLPAPPPPNAAPGKSRLRSAASTRSLTSFSSQESLVKLETSPQDAPSHSALLGLPGYRPVTRSSLRRLQGGGSSSSLGRSSFYLGTCQDEPEQLDDWNRIAELQQRNRACPPHLKTCYPLESRPSNILGTITDEEMKTGDPEETLRRASMQPVPIGAGITTRQQRKRLSDESHQGPDTPESKKPTSCFPRPQTPRERRSSQLARRSQVQPPAKQADKRQSLAFSILNTPKKLGNSLLRRAAGRKSTPRGTPRGGARRSPRIASAKSPKGKVGMAATPPRPP
ncbi:NUMA1 protein, partial [Alopecoenas beccarii]|nr:NUMA1 protein [Alopecoenas beccarii]